MQKFPIDSHSNENFICLFLRPPGAANPQTTSFPFTTFAKGSNVAEPKFHADRTILRWDILNRTNKQKQKQEKQT